MSLKDDFNVYIWIHPNASQRRDTGNITPGEAAVYYLASKTGIHYEIVSRYPDHVSEKLIKKVKKDVVDCVDISTVIESVTPQNISLVRKYLRINKSRELKQENNTKENGKNTFGSIKGENVIINIDSKDNTQSLNKGKKIKNVYNKNQDISDFLKDLKANIPELEISDDKKEDLNLEVQRAENQINRESPNTGIIDNALHTIFGILTGITANIYTPLVVELLDKLKELI